MDRLYVEAEVDGEGGWMPTAYLLGLLKSDGFGLCVRCTQEHEEVAPEAVNLKCISCGHNKVFGTTFLGK